MNLTQTMKELKRLGNAESRKLMPRHGVTGPAFGVRYADLYKIQKRLQPDYELALKLWETGNHDARVLATLIVDAGRIKSRELDSWIGAVDNHVINTAVAGVVAKSPHARNKADAWRKVTTEWKSAAGWEIVGYMAAQDGATDGWLGERLAEIQKKIDRAANRTRHSMNGTLISIGGYRPKLRAKALKIATALGKVHVDHGKTSCKTPDATTYIGTIAKHQSAKRKKKT